MDIYEHLYKLSLLHKAGVLTDEEFAEQKATLLRSASPPEPSVPPAPSTTTGPAAPPVVAPSPAPADPPPPPPERPVGGGMKLAMLLTLGLGTPFVLWYAHSRLRTAAARKSAILYTVLLAVYMVAGLAGVPELGGPAIIWIWIGGTLRAFGLINEINQKERERLLASSPNAAAEAQVRHRRRMRARARELAAQDPGYARELGIGRPDLLRSYDDGGLVDVNRAPAEVVATLPGIGEETATRVVALREEIGPFVSAEDLAAAVSLDPRLVPELTEYALFTQ